ncbi:hypothetical protein D3C85_1932480 [compost metagenome]
MNWVSSCGSSDSSKSSRLSFSIRMSSMELIIQSISFFSTGWVLPESRRWIFWIGLLK